VQDAPRPCDVDLDECVHHVLGRGDAQHRRHRSPLAAEGGDPARRLGGMGHAVSVSRRTPVLFPKIAQRHPPFKRDATEGLL
jgi:hypothetical protein